MILFFYVMYDLYIHTLQDRSNSCLIDRDNIESVKLQGLEIKSPTPENVTKIIV